MGLHHGQVKIQVKIRSGTGVESGLRGARRGLFRTVFHRDRPGFGLLFMADRAIGVA